MHYPNFQSEAVHIMSSAGVRYSSRKVRELANATLPRRVSIRVYWRSSVNIYHKFNIT